MILYLNACVREESRTDRLARYLLARLAGPVKEVRLTDLGFPKADAAFLSARDKLVAESAFSDPMFDAAREFAAADTIVLAAPFWDLSFPAAVKQYFEQINVVGITFFYTPDGIPQGLCRAKKLYYVTTAGGTIFSEDYGYGYVQALAKGFYGIEETELIKAEGLDVIGADEQEILGRAESAIAARFPA
mgnify:CR=1 FL=1